MGTARFVYVGVLAACLARCAPQARDPGADAQAAAMFNDLRHHRNAALQNRLDSHLLGPDLSVRLMALERLLPAGEPGGRRAIETHTSSAGGVRAISTIDEYAYGDRVALVETRQRRVDPHGDWQVQGFHIDVVTRAELAANDFTLHGKSIAQYGFLLAATVTPVAMLTAVAKCIATRGLTRKWLWCLVACVGVCGLQMNWRTGAVHFLPLTVQLLGVGFWRQSSVLSPWLVTTTIPLGAVAILTGALTLRRVPGLAGSRRSDTV
jgi:hypothetical protein